MLTTPLKICQILLKIHKSCNILANLVTLPSTSQKKVVQCDPSNIIIILTVFFSGRKPWTLGYGMRLAIWRSWVQIPTLYRHFFKLICFKNLNVCLKMNENKLKRGLGWPVLKTVFFAVFDPAFPMQRFEPWGAQIKVPMLSYLFMLPITLWQWGITIAQCAFILRVRLPSTPSGLFSFIVKFVLYLSLKCEKRTKINKKETGFSPFKKTLLQLSQSNDLWQS